MLDGWRGWGSFPQVFDPRSADTGLVGAARHTLGQLEAILPGVTNIAAASTLNAHYTDPQIIDTVWAALRRLGVTDTAVTFEPGCGAGDWLRASQATPTAEAVEMDPIAAQITTWLTPATVTVHTARLERWTLAQSNAPDGFDLTIGNVPFADYAPSAPDNPNRHTLHNYAILKAVRCTKPGGLVAVLTSRYTLDAVSTQFRSELADLAELVTAIRLPTGAHHQHAGTDVVTDLLVLRPTPGGDPNRHLWAGTSTLAVGDDQVTVNDWWHHHRELMIGTPAVGGMYSRQDLRVLHDGARDGTWITDLHTRLTDETQRLTSSGRIWSPTGRAVAANDAPQILRAGERVDVEGVKLPTDSIIHDAGRFVRLSATGSTVEHVVRPARDVDELRQLLVLRNTVVALLDADAAGATLDASELRELLSANYHTYVHRFGPINRFKLVANPRSETGDTMVRRPSMGGFRRDPSWWTVAALEVFDEDTQVATRAPIFTDPVARRIPLPEHVDNPADAVAVCLSMDARLDPARLAGLLGVDVDDLDDTMGDLTYRNPLDGQLEPASLYLSGNVRDKLDVAAAAELDDPRWSRNVAALRNVLPRELGIDEVIPRLGASWIAPDDLVMFCRDVFDVDVDVHHIEELTEWHFATKARDGAGRLLEWGIPDVRGALDLVGDIANQRLTRVMRQIDENHSELDVEATEACGDKRVQIEAEFATWVWADPQRSARLLEVYNRRFNSWVEPNFDGSHLTLPGLATTFIPRQHQRDGVWRILASRDKGTLLAHAVGAGKTATMAIAVMEMRRLGIAPTTVGIVVPNSMLDQFSREFMQLYPQAKILTADDEEFGTERRRAFVAKVATGDFDAVVLTHSAFTRIPMSVEYQRQHVDNELQGVRNALMRARADRLDSRSVKKIENLLERRTAGLENKVTAAKHDSRSITFEQLGLSALFVDEAHVAKNLGFVTRIVGASPSKESARALDLLMKCDWMRANRSKGSVVFATATPISNRIGEMWVVQRFLHPDGLERARVREFDAWAANFGKTTLAVEVSPAGRGFRTTARFATFTNVPDLAMMFRSFTDVKLAADLNLPRPALHGGEPTVVAVDGGHLLDEFVDDLLRRATDVKARAVPPEVDNMLAISTDGRLGALDLRLIDPARQLSTAGTVLPFDYRSPKVLAAADGIAARYHTNKSRRYLTDGGQPATLAGSAQLVWCDQGTPGNQLADVYSTLRDELVERGVPGDKIAFIQNAKGHHAKRRLFAAVRDGRVAVLIGSTASMGVGVNVQTRLIASHTLTGPWRPDEVEQADGRILRQGNQNPEIELVRYVTARSFDAFTWQTIERKARFVHQIMSDPNSLAREIDDSDDGALSFAVVKAVATGDERILHAAKLDSKVQALERSRAQHHKSHTAISRRLSFERDRLSSLDTTIARTRTALAAHTPNTGVAIANPAVTREPDETDLGWLGRHTAAMINTAIIRAYQAPNGICAPMVLATVEGLQLQVDATSEAATVRVTDGTAKQRRVFIPSDVNKPSATLGVRMQNLVRSVATDLDDMLTDRQVGGRLVLQLEEQLNQPFANDATLTQLRTQLEALQQQLMEVDHAPAAETAPAPVIKRAAPNPPQNPARRIV